MGSVWEKAMSWFGINIHLIVDAVYEATCSFSGYTGVEERDKGRRALS